jgi:hypothetical protein
MSVNATPAIILFMFTFIGTPPFNEPPVRASAHLLNSRTSDGAELPSASVVLIPGPIHAGRAFFPSVPKNCPAPAFILPGLPTVATRVVLLDDDHRTLAERVAGFDPWIFAIAKSNRLLFVPSPLVEVGVEYRRTDQDSYDSQFNHYSRIHLALLYVDDGNFPSLLRTYDRPWLYSIGEKSVFTLLEPFTLDADPPSREWLF